jgi:hypothetical protein
MCCAPQYAAAVVYSVARLVARYHLSFGAGPVGQPLPDTLPPPSGLPRADLSLAVEAVIVGIYSDLGATRRCVAARYGGRRKRR